MILAPYWAHDPLVFGLDDIASSLGLSQRKRTNQNPQTNLDIKIRFKTSIILIHFEVLANGLRHMSHD